MRCFIFMYLSSKNEEMKAISHSGAFCYLLFIHSVVCLIIGP